MRNRLTRTTRMPSPRTTATASALRPSAMVREIASELAHRIPAVVRYLMRGLGSDESVTERASYLLFDSEFCGRLIDLGRRDVAAERDRIAEFFTADATASAGR